MRVSSFLVCDEVVDVPGSPVQIKNVLRYWWASALPIKVGPLTFFAVVEDPPRKLEVRVRVVAPDGSDLGAFTGSGLVPPECDHYRLATPGIGFMTNSAGRHWLVLETKGGEELARISFDAELRPPA